jgi:hypothetical protein
LTRNRAITLCLSVVLLGGSLWLTPPAGSVITPAMDAHTTGWSRLVRSPADIEIGQGAAPFLVGLTWQRWSGTYGNGTGKLHELRNPNCHPAPLCPYDVYNVKVYLHQVITHRGAAVFSRMRWTYGHAAHVLFLRLTSTGFWDY